MGIMSWLTGSGSGSSYTPDQARADNEQVGTESWIRNGGDRDAIERRALRDGIGGGQDYDTDPTGGW